MSFSFRFSALSRQDDCKRKGVITRALTAIAPSRGFGDYRGRASRLASLVTFQRTAPMRSRKCSRTV